MVRAYPYAPLGAQLRLSVAIFSYDGKVTFGISADFDANPDLDVLARGIEAGMAELLDAAAERHAAAERGTLVDLTAPEGKPVLRAVRS